MCFVTEKHWVGDGLYTCLGLERASFSSVAPAMASSSSWPVIMYQFQDIVVTPSSPMCSGEVRSLLENFISYSARKSFGLLLGSDIPEASLLHT